MATARTPDDGTRPEWHAMPFAEVVGRVQSDAVLGLAAKVAEERLSEHGPNTIAEAQQRSALTILVHQFASLLVGLLAAAAGIALLLGDTLEAGAILLVIVLNAAIGFATEWRAAGALDALRDQEIPQARVRRDGDERTVPASELVPGDVVLLAAGDRVPADGRVVEQAELRVDEAALTGESLPVSKEVEAGVQVNAPLGDRHNMLYRGTSVRDGRATMLVTETGQQTEMGHIGSMLQAVKDTDTPLEAQLAALSRTLMLVVLALCVVIVVIGWLRGHELLYMLEVGISLAIAAVPEGLLAVTTMTLALGVQRMARLHALVRRLPVVEALGSTTVICTDKTGTLTRNEMTVAAYHVDGTDVEVTGSGYEPHGEFHRQSDSGPRTANPAPDASETAENAAPLSPTLDRAIRIGAGCNDAKIDRSDAAPQILGDPTEAALLVAAEKAGMSLASLDQDYPRVDELPFSSETMRMVTVHSTPDGTLIAYMKGAPAAVLAACTHVAQANETTPLTDEARDAQLAANAELGAAALRVLGLAWRELPENYSSDDLTTGLTFAGLVGMRDPLREGTQQTLEVCRSAGIRTVMITGDQVSTATEIARQLGLDRDPDGQLLRTVHGGELHDLSDADWQALVKDTAVFARVSPEDKLRIVGAFQELGHIVAMTGDGVNDAPALRKADIGVAMGIRGTQVAKDAADMVLADDNFATIVAAVEQGRIVVQGIRRFIHFLFSCNLAEILTVFVAIIIGWPLPLGVLQILWLNLVTDVFPAMALALEPSSPGVMQQPPRDPDTPLLSLKFSALIVWQGGVLAACTLASFAIALRWYGAEGIGLQRAVTISFMTLALAQTAHAFNVRSRSRSLVSAHFLANRWLWGSTVLCVLLQVLAVNVPLLQDVLDTVPLDRADWALVSAGALMPVVIVEVVKLVQRRMHRGWVED